MKGVKMRLAISSGALKTIQDYLPSNYKAVVCGDTVLIYGRDDHGWTMDGYVIPRLASGLIIATEIKIDGQ